MTEEALYLPVKAYFESLGYTVKGEVKGCDAVCQKDSEMLICELKLHLNLEVVVQGVLRQRLAKKVYICVPQLTSRAQDKRWKDVMVLLKRLSLGLLVVHSGPGGMTVSEMLPAEDPHLSPNRKKKKAIEREFAERHGDPNHGGISRRKMITAYREKSVFLAALLQKEGPLPVRALVAAGADAKAGDILYRNYYGWFTRVSRGVYTLSPKGKEELADYQDLINVLFPPEI